MGLNLYALIQLLDADTPIQVEYRYTTIFRGMRDDFDLCEYYERQQIKAIYVKLGILVIEI